MWHIWGRRGAYRVLVGKPEGKKPLGRPRRRWVDNIRMDLQEVGYGYMDWIRLAQDRDRWRRLVSAVMNLRVPWNAGNFLTSCKPVSFSRRTLHHGVSKFILGLYRSFATRVSQFRIWRFWVICMERNFCRCTFNKYSVITRFAKLAAGEQLCRRCTHRKLEHFKIFKLFPWKITNFELWQCCRKWAICCVRISEQTATFAFYSINRLVFVYLRWRVFTARYGLIPYVTQIRLVFEGL